MRIKGDKVLIYEDIIDKHYCQGAAILLSKILDKENSPVEYWYVMFIMSGEIKKRLVLKRWEDMPVYWQNILGKDGTKSKQKKRIDVKI